MNNPIKSHDYGVVRMELQQRGAWQVIADSSLPNRTLACPATRELFYVQESPKLACWAQYENDQDFQRAFDNLTVNRLKPEWPIEAHDGQNQITSMPL